MEKKPILLKHLRQALKWAKKAREKEAKIGGKLRSYDQRRWSCGTSCCIHGAAHLAARGKDARTWPSQDDYADIDYFTRRLVLDILDSQNGSPEMIERVLANAGY